jgi:hypothetical protein
MSEQKVIRSTYKGVKIEVYPIETAEGHYVYDFMVNEIYWGTVFKLEEVQRYMDLFRNKVDRGENLHE